MATSARFGFALLLSSSLFASVGCEGDDQKSTNPDSAAGETAGGRDGLSGGETAGGRDGSGGESLAPGGSGSEAAGAPGNAGHEDPLAFLPLYENGTRLRAISLGEAGATTRRFVTWYDSELDTECSFMTAEDGVLRCLPRAQQLTPGFADAACTQAVFYDGLVSPCAEQPAYRHESVELDGCDGSRVVRMQPEQLAEVYHETCSAEPIVLGPAATAWSDLEPVAPGEFVAANVRERAGSEGFGVVELVTPDGARQVTAILDERYGRCGRREVEGGGTRCLPPVAFYDGPWWFQDDACMETRLAYGTPGLGCDQPRDLTLGLQVNPGSGDLPLVVSLGEVVVGPVYEQSFSTDACEARDTADVIWSLYPMGEPFDTELLLPLTEVAHGDGRVRMLHDAVDPVVLTYVPGDNGAVVLFDADRDERCMALRRVGGDWVCVPESAARAEVVHYADSECQQPVVSLGEAEPKLLAMTRRTFCVREGFADEVLGVYTLAGAYTGPLYGGPECALVTDQAEAGYVALEPAEDALPALVELTE